MSNINSKLSAASYLIRFLNFQSAKPASPENLKFAGAELAEIMKCLRLERRLDFATAMGVTPSCVGRWLNGQRKMQNFSAWKLEELVKLQTFRDEVGTTVTDSESDREPVVRIPCNIPHERITRLYSIATLLNEVGSEMTFLQVLTCLAD